jgi:hypothetical protein
MKKLTKREEANEIYSKVKSAINRYVKFNVKANEIKDYVINNIDRFIAKYKLSEISNVEQIIKDVVEHKNNIDKDKNKKKLIREMWNGKVVKFNNFKKINESIIEVGKSNVSHEKVLADYYNTSLGHIEEIDAENHVYNVIDFGKSQMVVIFSNEEINKIREKIVNDLVIEISDKNLIIEDVNGLKLGNEMSIQIGSIMDKSKLENFCDQEIDEKEVLSLIGAHLSKEIVFLYNQRNVNYVDKFESFHIWNLV